MYSIKSHPKLIESIIVFWALVMVFIFIGTGIGLNPVGGVISWSNPTLLDYLIPIGIAGVASWGLYLNSRQTIIWDDRGGLTIKNSLPFLTQSRTLTDLREVVDNGIFVYLVFEYDKQLVIDRSLFSKEDLAPFVQKLQTFGKAKAN